MSGFRYRAAAGRSLHEDATGSDMPADLLAAASWQETVRITDACTACGACLATCPEAALRKAPKRPLVLDASCTACWACIEICPADAIVEVPGPKGRTSPLTDSLGPEEPRRRPATRRPRSQTPGGRPPWSETE